MKSWQIGAISGLIAGIFLGIIYAITATVIMMTTEFPYFGLPPTDTPIWLPVSVHIGFSPVAGVILGIIYSKINMVISRKSIVKGLIFGLFHYSIFNRQYYVLNILIR